MVEYSSLDGGGRAADPDFQTIKVWCPLAVEYSLIKDGTGGIYAGAPLVVQYNVFGLHPVWMTPT